MFKNTKEREAFLKDYKKWGVWKEIPELNMTYYRYTFKNGACVVVTEYLTYSAFYKKNLVVEKYCLILPDEDDYKASDACGWVYFKHFTPNGHGISTIIDYMTKKRNEIGDVTNE